MNQDAPRRTDKSPSQGADQTKPDGAEVARSDQAPGEETVQVNDAYSGGGPAPDPDPTLSEQHQTGG